MSVNSSTLTSALQSLKNAQSTIRQDLHSYQHYIKELHHNITTTISSYFHQYQTNISSLTTTIKDLKHKIDELKEDNSHFRNKYMHSVIENQQLNDKCAKMEEENESKEEKIKELITEIQNIKDYIKSFQTPQQNEEIIHFDDAPLEHRFQTLETINQVSEHDLSVSMSIQSLCSYHIQEGNSSFKEKITEKQQDNELDITPKLEDYQIDNYQDALSILKNYTNGETVMPKKNKVDLTQAKENILANNIDSNKLTEQKTYKNCTMDKIKKMRKIDCLELQSGYVIKSDQKNIGFSKDSSEQSIKQSKIQQREGVISRLSFGAISGPTSGHSSISSTRIASQQIISLEEPIKNVNEVIEQINSAYRYSFKAENIRPSICKIQYAGGFEYFGGCDDKNLPSGYGKLSLKGDIIYQGEWRSGKMHGWGKLILLPFAKSREREIIQIDGNFRGGVLEGTALCIFSSGQRYMGMIRNGSIEHEGTFVSEKGILTGHWQGSCLVLLI